MHSLQEALREYISAPLDQAVEPDLDLYLAPNFKESFLDNLELEIINAEHYRYAVPATSPRQHSIETALK